MQVDGTLWMENIEHYEKEKVNQLIIETLIMRKTTLKGW